MGVLDAGIHSLAAGGAVEVGGVAGQQHPTDPVSRGIPPMLVVGCPPQRLDRWRPEQALDEPIDMIIDRVVIDTLVNRVCDDAEDAVAEADADHQPLVQERGPELGLIDLGRHADVRQHRAGGIGLAFEFETKRLAHHAMSAVGADEKTRL